MAKAPVQRFCVVNLGCKVNRVESDTLAAALLAQGAQAVPAQQAELIIVNTCTVTGEAEKKARKAVRGALQANDRAQVVVTGCASAIDPAGFASLGPRIQVVPRERLLEEALAVEAPPRFGAGFRTRASLKVQDGCDHACTYCIVHVARGPARSVPLAQVRAEFARFVAAGAREVVLAGIDLGSYRSDGAGLTQLLEALCQDSRSLSPEGEAPCRLRISSIEPQSIDDGLLALLAEANGMVCRHLHLPLQSGSSAVLGRMGRLYDAEGYLSLVERLYRAVPRLSLSTDVICGFPGETEEDFQRTLDASRQARFSRMHVFPYSPRQGTPAAAFEGQVPPEQKAERTGRLRDLASQLRRQDYDRRRGSRELVLVEPDCGVTESYHEIPLEGDFGVGSLIPVVLR